jgi:hypothetical protein
VQCSNTCAAEPIRTTRWNDFLAIPAKGDRRALHPRVAAAACLCLLYAALCCRLFCMSRQTTRPYCSLVTGPCSSGVQRFACLFASVSVCHRCASFISALP